MAGNAVLAGAVGALFVLAVLAHPAHIHAVSHAGNGLEGLGHRRVGDLLDALHHLAALDAAGSLHDDVITGADIRIGRVKIIAFAVFFETDRNDFFHSSPRLLVRSIGKKAAKGPIAPF